MVVGSKDKEEEALRGIPFSTFRVAPNDLKNL
jgi:hypothetical protein